MKMNLKKFAGELLAHQCPSGDKRPDNVWLYEFELHCAYVYVVAKSVGDSKYDILYVDFQSFPNDEALEKAQTFRDLI